MKDEYLINLSVLAYKDIDIMKFDGICHSDPYRKGIEKLTAEKLVIGLKKGRSYSYLRHDECLRSVRVVVNKQLPSNLVFEKCYLSSICTSPLWKSSTKAYRGGRNAIL